MKMQCYSDAGAFLECAGAFLEQQEAINSLPLGLAHYLHRTPGSDSPPPFFGTLSADGEMLCAGVMTPPRPLLLHSTLPEARAAYGVLAEHLREHAWPVSGVIGPTDVAAQFAKAWSAQTGVPSQVKVRMLAYTLETVTPPPAVPGHFRVAGEADTGQVIAWAQAFQIAINEPSATRQQFEERIPGEVATGEYFLWDDGGPVSMARRTRPTRHGICVGGVYTPPEFQRRGYAAACVAALSQRLLDDGKRFCMLFADAANPTSNGIYRRIGYRPQAEFTHYVFPEQTA